MHAQLPDDERQSPAYVRLASLLCVDSAAMKAVITLDSVTLSSRGSGHLVNGSTVAGRHGSGRALPWRVEGPDELLLDIEDVLWDDGTREVRGVEAYSSPRRFERLASGLRLGVHRHSPDRWHARLRIARLTSDDWSQAYKTDARELCAATGIEPTKVLRDAGADVIGTAEVAYGEAGRGRTEFAVSFRGDDSPVPAVAWTLTRVLPVLNRWA